MGKVKRVQHYELYKCEVCGKPFRSARKHVKTCSATCRKRRSRAGQGRTQKSVTEVTLFQLDFMAQVYDQMMREKA